MVERKVIVDKISTFVSGKLNEILDNNPFSFIIKPYVSRVANNSFPCGEAATLSLTELINSS